MKRETPNPTGNKGKPFTLAPHSFEDALRKILSAPPEPKPDKGKSGKKKATKKHKAA
ncbi:MAG: hypothetical protein H7Z16_02125 [Pyrinomonadaceae bacterium]|nr:hypothetical protein [Pyrinomonadaceae bacterium]